MCGEEPRFRRELRTIHRLVGPQGDRQEGL